MSEAERMDRRRPAKGKRKIYLTELDMGRLKPLLALPDRLDQRDRRHLDELAKELRRGEVVAPEEIPPNVITMNSKVRLRDLDSGEEAVYSLVYPPDADIRQNRISILAPIGTALIGYAVGDVIEWKVPGGVARLKVEEILYQPEAAGRWDL